MMKVEFWVEKRRNAFAKYKYEWALYIRATTSAGRPWCLANWDHNPSKDEIDFVKQVTLRSCEFYHMHLDPPRFDLEEQK